ncbi:MAG: hypothetical protein AB7I18_14515 [Candidatus Berkiella sp.]
MTYTAEVIRLNDDIEEEVVLRINGVELTCFASVCPYPIVERATYEVALIPVVFDDYSVREMSKDTHTSLVKVGNGFAYELVGELAGGLLDIGCISLEDDVLLRDYGYLNGKIIAWMIDRIDVEFM